MECEAEGHIGTPLVCMLAADHPGLHWDGEENISWKEGRPDER